MPILRMLFHFANQIYERSRWKVQVCQSQNDCNHCNISHFLAEQVIWIKCREYWKRDICNVCWGRKCNHGEESETLLWVNPEAILSPILSLSIFSHFEDWLETSYRWTKIHLLLLVEHFFSIEGNLLRNGCVPRTLKREMDRHTTDHDGKVRKLVWDRRF